MNSRDIYAFVAAMLLVCLGLGLIYLYAMGRVSALAVFALLLGGCVAIALLVAIREIEERRSHGPKARSAGRPPFRA